MYEHFYGLKAEPFRLSPDHRFCFSHQSYAKSKAYMQYAYQRAEGFVMITGRPGTGKSTLVNDLIHTLSGENIDVAKLVCTQLEANDLLRMVAHAFKIQTLNQEKSTVIQNVGKKLASNYRDNRRTLLIIDEAQDLSTSALEELRLLTNLQINNQPLLQIFLLGQEQLRNLIQNPDLEQVQQRLVATCHLQPLKEEETREYIKHRLRQAGWRGDPALSEAIYPVIYKFSEGIPRRINLICSRLFLQGAVEELHEIGIRDLREAVIELQNEQLAPANMFSDMDFVDEDVYVEESAPKQAETLPFRRSAASPPPNRAVPDNNIENLKTRLSLEDKPDSRGNKANFQAKDIGNSYNPHFGRNDRRTRNRRTSPNRRATLRFEPWKSDRRKNRGRRKEDQQPDPWGKTDPDPWGKTDI